MPDETTLASPACRYCGNQPPDRSRYCNICGKPLIGETPEQPPAPHVEHRWIYIDLYDLKLPAYLGTLDSRAEAVSYLYERFTPFADEGWEWVVHPADQHFSGWLYQDYQGSLKLAGAELFCRRIRVPRLDNALDTPHHLSSYRLQQLSKRHWGLTGATRTS